MSNRAMVKLAFVAGVSLSSLMAPAAVAQAHSAQGMKSYSIAGGDLRSVLKTFAAQSGLRFIFRTRDVEGLRSSGLKWDVHTGSGPANPPRADRAVHAARPFRCDRNRENLG